jgi:hypothetical protein
VKLEITLLPKKKPCLSPSTVIKPPNKPSIWGAESSIVLENVDSVILIFNETLALIKMECPSLPVIFLMVINFRSN